MLKKNGPHQRYGRVDEFQMREFIPDSDLLSSLSTVNMTFLLSVAASVGLVTRVILV